MSANDLLSILLQLAFILLGALTTLDYVRHRDRTRRDIALMFDAFALPFILQIIGKDVAWLGAIAWMGLLASPYLLLRLVRYFRPIPSRIRRVALGGMLLSWTAFALAGLMSRGLQAVLAALIIAYVVAIDGYAMVAFIHDTQTTTGIVRQRLRFAAAGSAFLALTFFALGLQVFVPTFAELFTSIMLLAATAAAVSYYVAFAPPRWLRRAWQLTELRTFLTQVNQKHDSTLDEICNGAKRAVGGIAAMIVKVDTTGEKPRIVHEAGTPSDVFERYLNGEGLLYQHAEKRTSTFVRAATSLCQDDIRLLEAIKADILFLIPMTSETRSWGMLAVFQRYSSLFVDDDADLLGLLVQQGTTVLENGALIEALRLHSQELEKRVEERSHELEESQIQYRRILETAQEGVWVTTSDNRTLFANARMAEILGSTVEEMMPVSTLSFVEPDQVEVVRQARLRRKDGVKEQYELRFRRRDGTDVYTLVAATPLTDDNGQTIGSLAMVADITERKKAEDELRNLNAELEKRVEDRTAELSIANRELEAFSYSVSHDLRGPLRAMDGFGLALLEDYGDQLDEEGKDYLTRIRGASQRMGLLIDSLLQLSQLSRTEMQVKRVDLSKLANSIVQDLREQYPERQVEFVIQDGLIVQGDEGLLRAALMNLFNNACKFSSKQPHPCVEFGRMPYKDGQAYFVRDNGVGFDMDHARLLFGPFQRLHSTHEFEGTGIGLATVERIIRRHKGTIWAEAAVNQGAIFYFMI